MYEKHFGLSEKPFSIVPNPSFLYLTDKHRNALTHLEYGLMEGVGFVLLTGEVGAGKTTLIRHLLNQVEEDMLAAVIFNTNVTAEQLIALILQEFELEPRATKAENLDLLYDFFINQFAAGKKVLLIIDEAQNLADDVLEEVRMLSNLHSDDQLFLQIMLVGQPALKATLKKPSLTQLAQRIAVNYHLAPLSRDESEAYIAARLTKVGGREDLFSKEAIHLIHDAAGGIPRSINLMCDAALVYGFADDLQAIDATVIEQVLQDKGGMGLEVAIEDNTAPLPASQGMPHEGQNLRLRTLEENVRALQLQMDVQVEMRGRAGEFRDDMVNKLTGLLKEERDKYDSLLAEHVRLQEKCEAVNRIAVSGLVGDAHPTTTTSSAAQPQERTKTQVKNLEKKKGWLASLWPAG